jgi:hypothetical protein
MSDNTDPGIYYFLPIRLNKAFFNLSRKGIDIEWMDYSNYPEYNQLYPPFEHAVSIIDLIFNEGDNATKYMKSFDKL